MLSFLFYILALSFSHSPLVREDWVFNFISSAARLRFTYHTGLSLGVFGIYACTVRQPPFFT